MRLAPAAAVTLLVLVISVKSKIADEVGTVIAIDLGRSYSRVAVPKDSSNVNIIATIPSYVSFTQDEEFVVGAEAVNQLGTNPENTIFDMMRLIGQEWSNLNVQNDIKLYPFKVIHNNTKLLFQVSTGQDVKSFTPEEILAKVLLKLKVAAEEYLGETVEHTVVTVPAYFNEAQKQAIRDAGTIAGLHMIRILHESSAAAIGAGLQDLEGEKHILVFDLGGRRLDVTLLNIDNGVFDVVTHWGDTHIGGQYFDDRVMDHFIKIIETKGKDIRNDNQAIQKLRKEVEEAKRSLSVTDQAMIRIESLFDEFEEPDFFDTLSRSKFEELNMDLFKSTLTSIEKVIEDGQMKKEDVDEIVLSGGSSRIPFIHQLVKEFFGGKQPVQGINPEEVVICGAASQAAILSEEPADSTCVWLCGYEFTRLTLGIEAVGGMMAVLIPRNARFPTKKSQIFSTATDNQSTVTIQIFEGERPLTKDNRLLYKFELAGIPAAPRGVPQIEVTFQIDPNEILHVEAEDKETGNKVDISFTSYQTRLKEEDIEQIVTDAENFFEDDKKIRETIEARNELEFYPSQQTGSYSLAPGRKRDEL